MSSNPAELPDSDVSLFQAIRNTDKKTIVSFLGGCAGNVVEWYDWLSYTTFSLYFSAVFFPASDQTAQLLNTAAIFAVGYLMRPIGALALGYYADRVGRRAALTLSVVMMCVGSLMIALTPGYAEIGVAAPIILILARLIQGLSVGGEYGTSAAYLLEVTPPKHRGFFVSFHYVTLLAGQLLAVVVLLLLQYVFLTPAELDAWGWRIPFFLGAAFALIAFYARQKMEETGEFISEKSKVTQQKPNPIKWLIQNPKSVFMVMGLTVGGSVAVNTFSVYMPKFLVNTVGFSKAESTVMSAITIILFMLMQPIVGALSDKLGRKPMLITFGILGSLLTAPIMFALSDTKSITTAFFLVVAGLLISSGYSAVNAAVKAELFPTGSRALGVGLPYAIVVAVFGGTSEYVGLLFKQVGNPNGYYWYVSACIFISLLFYLKLPETRPAG